MDAIPFALVALAGVCLTLIVAMERRQAQQEHDERCKEASRMHAERLRREALSRASRRETRR